MLSSNRSIQTIRRSGSGGGSGGGGGGGRLGCSEFCKIL